MATRIHAAAPPTGIDAVTGPPKLGPPLPGTTPSPTAGLTGRAKFEALVNSMPFGKAAWGHDFNQWVLSLKPDPSDTEFNNILVWAQNNAKSHEAGTAKSLGGPPEQGGPKSRLSALNLPADIPNAEENKNRFSVPGNVPPPSDPGGGPPTGVAPKVNEIDDRAGRREAGKVTKWMQPTFKGAPIKPDEIYGAGEDDFLHKFRTEQGIQLTDNDKSLALRSGNYVYMGTEHNTQYNVDRDVFYYVDDADNALVDLGPATLSGYQAALKNPVTGKTDKVLDGLWKQAVLDASKYAARGQKVTVRELMDLYVAGQAGGAGGGGGGGAAKLEDIDYYRAMMQVLGDISGVGHA